MSICLIDTFSDTPSFTDGVIGCYERPTPSNDWHYVQITKSKNTDTFTWENRAGKTWSLLLIPGADDGWNTTNLAVGEDCPYFVSGHKFAGLEWKGQPGASELSAIRGPGNELYQRKNCTGGKSGIRNEIYMPMH